MADYFLPNYWSDVMPQVPFESLPGIVGFVARAVNSHEGFRLSFSPENIIQIENPIQHIRKPNEMRYSMNLDVDTSAIDWVDEALAESFRLRRF